MRLMYVFDYRETSGYVARVPEFVARLWTGSRFGRWLDYAPSEAGLQSWFEWN